MFVYLHMHICVRLNYLFNFIYLHRYHTFHDYVYKLYPPIHTYPKQIGQN